MRFGAVRTTQTEVQTVIVSNAGDLALKIARIAALDPLEPPFALLEDGCSTRVLLPGGACGLLLGLSPAGSGRAADSFSVTSSDPGLPLVTVAVAGTGVEPVGIGAPALADPKTLRCENLFTGESDALQFSGAQGSCEGGGLALGPGAPVSMAVFGVAALDQALRGSALGIGASLITCQNRTTGQSVPIVPAPDQSTWDCVAAGLAVTEGDDLAMTVNGRAY